MKRSGEPNQTEFSGAVERVTSQFTEVPAVSGGSWWVCTHNSSFDRQPILIALDPGDWRSFTSALGASPKHAEDMYLALISEAELEAHRGRNRVVQYRFDPQGQ